MAERTGQTSTLIDRIQEAQARAALKVISEGMREDLQRAQIEAGELVVIADLARIMASLDHHTDESGKAPPAE